MGIIKFMSQALDSVLEILKTMPLESPLKSLSLSKNSKKTLEIWFSMGCTHMENVCLLPPAREYNLKTDPKSDPKS